MPPVFAFDMLEGQEVIGWKDSDGNFHGNDESRYTAAGTYVAPTDTTLPQFRPQGPDEFRILGYDAQGGAVVQVAPEYAALADAHAQHLYLDQHPAALAYVNQPWDDEDPTQAAWRRYWDENPTGAFGDSIIRFVTVAPAAVFGGPTGFALAAGATAAKASKSEEAALAVTALGAAVTIATIAKVLPSVGTAGDADISGGVGEDTLAGGEAADKLTEAAPIGVQAAAQALPDAAATAGSSGFSFSNFSTILNIGKTLAGIGLTIAGVGEATSAGKGGTASSVPRPPVQTVTNIAQRQVPVALPSPHYASQYLSTVYSGGGTAGDAGSAPETDSAEAGVSIPPPQGSDLSGTMLFIVALALAWALAQRSLHHV